MDAAAVPRQVAVPGPSVDTPLAQEGSGGGGGRRWRRCVVVCPLVVGVALLVSCFLQCPMLWQRLPLSAFRISGSLLALSALASVWALLAAAALLGCALRRRRSRRRPRRVRRHRRTSPPYTRSRRSNSLPLEAVVTGRENPPAEQ